MFPLFVTARDNDKKGKEKIFFSIDYTGMNTRTFAFGHLIVDLFVGEGEGLFSSLTKCSPPSPL